MHHGEELPTPQTSRFRCWWHGNWSNLPAWWKPKSRGEYITRSVVSVVACWAFASAGSAAMGYPVLDLLPVGALVTVVFLAIVIPATFVVARLSFRWSQKRGNDRRRPVLGAESPLGAHPRPSTSTEEPMCHGVDLSAPQVSRVRSWWQGNWSNLPAWWRPKSRGEYITGIVVGCVPGWAFALAGSAARGGPVLQLLPAFALATVAVLAIGIPATFVVARISCRWSKRRERNR